MSRNKHFFGQVDGGIRTRKRLRVQRLESALPPSGVYQVMFVMPRRRIRIGTLGEIDFAAGVWVYTGSARRALPQRVQRHAGEHKKLRWHIDHCLPPGRVIAVRAFAAGTVGECEAHRRLGELFVEGPRGFGCSDCRCSSHLVYLGEKGWQVGDFLPILVTRGAKCCLTAPDGPIYYARGRALPCTRNRGKL